MKISALGVEEQRTNVILQFADPAAAASLGHDYRVDARVAVEEILDTVRAPLGALFRPEADWAVYKIVDGRTVLTKVDAGSADTNYRVHLAPASPPAMRSGAVPWATPSTMACA